MKKFGRHVLLLSFLYICSTYAQISNSTLVKPPLEVLHNVRISVLVDNMSGYGPILGEWGVAFLIETEKHQILFDTGAGRVLLGNAAAMGLNLRNTEAIVISHGHADHTEGLEKVLDACGKTDMFVHPTAFDQRYWKEDTGAVAYSLPLSRQQLFQRVNQLFDTVNPACIREGLMVTGQIPRKTDFEDTGVSEYAFLVIPLKVKTEFLGQWRCPKKFFEKI